MNMIAHDLKGDNNHGSDFFMASGHKVDRITKILSVCEEQRSVYPRRVKMPPRTTFGKSRLADPFRVGIRSSFHSSKIFGGCVQAVLAPAMLIISGFGCGNGYFAPETQCRRKNKKAGQVRYNLTRFADSLPRGIQFVSK